LKLLFLCSQNKRRSLTAQHVLNGLNDWEVKSAGTERNARTKVTAGLIGWADIIFTMEKKHTRRINEKYQWELLDKRVICLYITDDYEYMDDALVQMLKTQIPTFVLE